ncbi:MAG TPA: hypothetical protein VJ476_14270 [Rhizomicrobium sp.]|nr:hypothetical protein [Rhizomicrobium sp.]
MGLLTTTLERVRPRTLVLCAALAATLAVASCESVDEGVSDYRKADINKASGAGAPTDVSKKYALTGPHNGLPGGEAGDVPIVSGDKFYVSLLQAYVGPDAGFRGSVSFGGKEEMVIVLRVRDSNDPTDPGRFAFYSDDVERGQFLNFSNLLTLGPTNYGGGVITIDLDEVRLIGNTAHIKEKLQELADDPEGAFGPDPAKRENWRALARNVFDIIDSDSYGTRYTLTLLPSGGIAGLPYPRFEAGNYVLMRHEDRRDSFEWDNLQLDNNTGRLVAKGATAEYRDRSYVTLQINALRQIPATAPDTTKVNPPSYKPLDRDKRKS